jgi:hypothetical protein
VERLTKFKEEKKTQWKQKLEETSKTHPPVENSPPTKGPKSKTKEDKEAVRMSRQLGREVASAMKSMSKVMEHAFKPIYD